MERLRLGCNQQSRLAKPLGSRRTVNGDFATGINAAITRPLLEQATNRAQFLFHVNWRGHSEFD
jgi:hypothetical protein